MKLVSLGFTMGGAGTGAVALNPITYSSDVGDVSVMKVLLDARADANWQGDGGNNALMMAAGRGDFKKMQLLIEREPFVNAINGAGYSALFFAVKSGSVSCVELLLRKGADIKHIDEDGGGVLHLVSNGAMAELLIKAGAPLNIRERHLRQSPLGRAIEYANMEVARALMLAGARIERDDLKYAQNRFVKNAFERLQIAIQSEKRNLC